MKHKTFSRLMEDHPLRVLLEIMNMKLAVSADITKQSFVYLLAVAVLVIACVPVSVFGQTTFPRINFALPSGADQDVCIEPGSLVDISNQNGDIIMLATAAAEDLSCPGEDPVINSFSASPAVLDITTNNCDSNEDGMDDAVCLFLEWDITPAITSTSCSVRQIQPPGKLSMIPDEFRNPNTNPTDPEINLPESFVPDINSLQWRVNTGTAGTATAGQKEFRMRCVSDSGSPQIAIAEATFQDGATPTVTIDSFNIQESQATRGSTINFDWNVTLNNNPPAPQCVLSSPGVINPRTVAVDANPGSSTATILAAAPLGNATFTFSCRASAGSEVTDQATDIVEITDSGPSDCPAPIVATRDTSQTTYSSAHGNATWPEPAGNPFNITVATNAYKALQFEATSGVNGNYRTVEAPVVNNGSVLLSISECPGDFSQTPADCVDGPSLKSRVIWADPAVSQSFCQLEPGRTYYLNMYFGDINGVNGCAFTSCVTRGRNQVN